MKNPDPAGKPGVRARPLMLIAAVVVGLLGGLVLTNVLLHRVSPPPPKHDFSTPWFRANFAAAVFNAAQAAGLDFMALADDDLPAALDLMAEGRRPQSPPFNDTTFVARSLQGLDPATREEVLQYLDFNPDTRELQILPPEEPDDLRRLPRNDTNGGRPGTPQ